MLRARPPRGKGLEVTVTNTAAGGLTPGGRRLLMAGSSHRPPAHAPFRSVSDAQRAGASSSGGTGRLYGSKVNLLAQKHRRGASHPGSRRISQALLLSVLTMLFPFFYVFHLRQSQTDLVSLLAVAWLFQTSILGWVVLSRSTRVDGLLVLLGFCAVTAQVVTLLFVSFSATSIDGRDVASIPIQFVTVIVFLGLLATVEVRKEDVTYFADRFVLIALAASVYNAFANAEVVSSFQLSAAGYDLQMRSIFPNRNQFGAFLFLAIVALCYRAAGRGGLRKPDVLYASILLMSLVLTMSRGALLATGMFLGLLVIPRILTRPPRLAVAVVLLAAASVAVLTHLSYVASVLEVVLRPEVGLSGRDRIWSMGFRVFAEANPLLGTGYYTGVGIAMNRGLGHDQFHSMYVDALVRGGLLGVTFLVLILFAVAFKVLRSSGFDEFRRIWLCSFVATLVLGAFESVSFFSLGFTDTLFTVFIIGLAMLIANVAGDPARVPGLEPSRVESDIGPE